jgi:hypothetical protein
MRRCTGVAYGSTFGRMRFGGRSVGSGEGFKENLVNWQGNSAKNVRNFRGKRKYLEMGCLREAPRASHSGRRNSRFCGAGRGSFERRGAAGSEIAELLL